MDEISEMPAMLQSKLLRVIEERSVRRFGSRKELMSNVRILADTNQVRRNNREGTLREICFTA